MVSRRTVDRVLLFVDLVLVVEATVLLWVVLTIPPLRTGTLRSVVSTVYVLFVPGYALVSALVPETSRSAHGFPGTFTSTAASRLDGLDRLLLSVAVSIALTVPVGLLLGQTAIGFSASTLGATLSLVSLLGVAVAVLRRLRLPESERFDARKLSTVDTLRRTVGGQSGSALLVNGVLVCSVVLVVGSVGYAVAFSQPAEPMTEFSVLAQNDDGEYVARDYVRPADESLRPLRIEVTNREHEQVNYTLVVRLERLAASGTRTTAGPPSPGTTTVEEGPTVVEATELSTRTLSLEHGETWQLDGQFTLPAGIDAQDHRLTFLLYRGDPPQTRTVETAYRHLWIDLLPEEGASTTTAPTTMASTTTAPTTMAPPPTTEAPTTTAPPPTTEPRTTEPQTTGILPTDETTEAPTNETDTPIGDEFGTETTTTEEPFG